MGRMAYAWAFILRWLPAVFEMAVVILATFGIMFVILVWYWLLKTAPKRKPGVDFCIHCGREVSPGENLCEDCRKWGLQDID